MADLQAYEVFLEDKLLRSRYGITAELAEGISRSPMDRVIDRIIRRTPSGAWKMVDLRRDPDGHRRLARAYTGEAIVTRIDGGLPHRYVADAVTTCLLLQPIPRDQRVVEIGPAIPLGALTATRLGRDAVYQPSCRNCAAFVTSCMPELEILRTERCVPSRDACIILTGTTSTIPSVYDDYIRSAARLRFRFEAGLVSLIGQLDGAVGEIEYAPAWPVEMRQVRTAVVREPEVSEGIGIRYHLDPSEMLDFALFCEARGVDLVRVRIQDAAGATRIGIGHLADGLFAIGVRSGEAVGSSVGLKNLSVLLAQFRDAASPGPHEYEVRLSGGVCGECLVPTIHRRTA